MPVNTGTSENLAENRTFTEGKKQKVAEAVNLLWVLVSRDDAMVFLLGDAMAFL